MGILLFPFGINILDNKLKPMKNLIISLSIFALFTFGCSENDNRKKVDKKMEKEAAAPIDKHNNRAFYPIPSPEQMFGFINDNGVSYNSALLNDPSNVEKYAQPTEKALNFGVYTADLAYSAAYQDIKSTVMLYKTVKRLGGELNISEMMTEEMMTKMQANMENPDSLALIAGNSYYQAVEYLESNGQEGKLALMSLGGWIESLYITVNAVSKFDSNSSTAKRIASQKITFGNLYTYLKKNEDKTGVKKELDAIQPIRAVFASLLEESSAKKTTNENGKLVFGRGKKIILSEAQFNELKAAINTYRNQLTANTPA